MTSSVSLLLGGSRVRQEILLRFFSQPDAVWHPRALGRVLGRSSQAVGRELDRLERAGVLRSELVGRARRYRVDDASPIADDLRRLVHKTLGVEALLRQAVASLPGVEEAFLFGSYARGDERPSSDIDVMLIGSVDQVALSERLLAVEQALGRDVNAVTYDRAEFERLQRSQNPFLRDVLSGLRVVLKPARWDTLQRRGVPQPGPAARAAQPREKASRPAARTAVGRALDP